MQFPIRPKNKFLINITSLIDVLFMLLLFVLVSSSFIENPGIKIDLPGTRNADAVTKTVYTLYVGKDGELHLNEQRVSEQELESALEKALPQIQDESLTLNADESVNHGLIVRLMDIAKKSGIKKLIIGTVKR